VRFDTHTLKRSWPLIAGAGAFLAGLVLGMGISALARPRYHVPTQAELERLCAVDPGVTVRRWPYIVLHHSADAVGDAAAFDTLHRRKRGWARGLGYDFVIGNGSLSGDGEIEAGHRWRRQLDGAHCKAGDMNRKAIGICFVGNFDGDRGPTAAQVHSGIALVRHLSARFDIPPESVLGHGEVQGGNTLCPGRSFPLELMRAAAQ